jgi:hypothetical protein
MGVSSGNADLRAPGADDESDLGPVAQALRDRKFDRVLLLATSHAPEIISPLADDLSARCNNNDLILETDIGDFCNSPTTT